MHVLGTILRCSQIFAAVQLLPTHAPPQVGLAKGSKLDPSLRQHQSPILAFAQFKSLLVHARGLSVGVSGATLQTFCDVQAGLQTPAQVLASKQAPSFLQHQSPWGHSVQVLSLTVQSAGVKGGGGGSAILLHTLVALHWLLSSHVVPVQSVASMGRHALLSLQQGWPTAQPEHSAGVAQSLKTTAWAGMVPRTQSRKKVISSRSGSTKCLIFPDFPVSPLYLFRQDCFIDDSSLYVLLFVTVSSIIRPTR